MTPIPQGWEKIKGTTVKKGDKIRTEFGWADADYIGYRDNPASAIGHPTSLYECVIRKIKDKPC